MSLDFELTPRTHSCTDGAQQLLRTLNDWAFAGPQPSQEHEPTRQISGPLTKLDSPPGNSAEWITVVVLKFSIFSSPVLGLLRCGLREQSCRLWWGVRQMSETCPLEETAEAYARAGGPQAQIELRPVPPRARAGGWRGHRSSLRGPGHLRQIRPAAAPEGIGSLLCHLTRVPSLLGFVDTNAGGVPAWCLLRGLSRRRFPGFDQRHINQMLAQEPNLKLVGAQHLAN